MVRKPSPPMPLTGTHNLFHLGLLVPLWPPGPLLGPPVFPIKVVAWAWMPGLTTFESLVWGPNTLELDR